MLEKQILGAMMLDEKAFQIGVDTLTANHFTGENQDIFKVVKSVGKADQFEVAKVYGDYKTIMAITQEVDTPKKIRSQCATLKEVSSKESIKAELYSLISDNNMTLDEIKSRLDTMSHQIETNDIQSEIRDVDKEPYKGASHIYNKFISTGLPTIDFALDDLVGGFVTLVAGRNNGGKTTFVNQVIANAIDNQHKVLVVNGEEKQDITLNKLYKAVIGRDEKYYKSIKPNKRYRTEPTDEALAALKRWHYGKLKLFSKGESNLKSTDQLFNLVKREIKKTETDLVVLDNLMSLLIGVSDMEKNGKQADFLKNCCSLAKEYNTHIIVVLHPNKSYTKGSEMESEQISGTGDLPNQADNIITVIREYDPMKISEGVNGYIQVQKNREFSDLPKIEVYFEHSTGLLLELNARGEAEAYNFKWKEYLNTPPWEV